MSKIGRNDVSSLDDSDNSQKAISSMVSGMYALSDLIEPVFKRSVDSLGLCRLLAISASAEPNVKLDMSTLIRFCRDGAL